MQKNQNIADSFSRRVRMSSGEIALALAVTVAAAAYIIASAYDPTPETASMEVPSLAGSGAHKN